MKFLSLQRKDVIDASTGSKIGFVSDIEIDPLCHQIIALIIEKNAFFHLLWFFKGPPCIVIPIENVLTIGEDVIIVKCD